MLDIKFIRENKNLVKAGAIKKHMDIDLDGLLSLDDKRLELMSRIENLRSEQNKVSLVMGGNLEANKRVQLIEEMTIVKEELNKKEKILKEVIKEWRTAMLLVPNIPDISVPEGNGEEDNKEIKRWG